MKYTIHTETTNGNPKQGKNMGTKVPLYREKYKVISHNKTL